MKKNIRKNRPSLLLLIVLVGFPQISESMFTPSLPNIGHYYEVSSGAAQLTMSIYFVSFALGVFFWGLISDFIGRRKAMLYGLVVYSLGSFMCLVAFNFEWLLAARFIQAFGASAGSIISQTMMRESFEGSERAKLFSKISAVLAFSPAIGPFIGGIVQEYSEFKMVFIILLLMGFAIWFYGFLKLPETLVVSERKRQSMLVTTIALLENRKALIYGLLIGGINGMLFSYHAEAPYLFIEHFKMRPSYFGLLGIVIALSSILGSLISNHLLRKKSPDSIIPIGLIVTIVGSSLLLLISRMTGFDQDTQMFFLVCCIFLVFVGTGITLPNCLSQGLADFQSVIGTAGGIFSLGYYLVVSLLTYGMSSLHNGSLWMMPLYFLGISCVMFMLDFLFVHRK
ncbi:multidrug effflux MFS transporter [Isobaculum melis]|uniref:Bcr/CflA family efflux transporter n=1 Tax=Isobaculum melis TaxID=142588 RepID=A0A1H9R767_9LACT|nr:multidrug effflux MFS transporter [Isobaculum melis]SER68566.1 polar amino acid transport system substrate-binding protein [Isobaculum melis]